MKWNISPFCSFILQICSLHILVFDQSGKCKCTSVICNVICKCCAFVFWMLTSLISFILAPPFPMREPHWLAGMTSRRVTGGLELMVPLATSAVRSWGGGYKRRLVSRKEKKRSNRRRESPRGEDQIAGVKVEMGGETSHIHWCSLQQLGGWILSFIRILTHIQFQFYQVVSLHVPTPVQIDR